MRGRWWLGGCAVLAVATGFRCPGPDPVREAQPTPGAVGGGGVTGGGGAIAVGGQGGAADGVTTTATSTSNATSTSGAGGGMMQSPCEKACDMSMICGGGPQCPLDCNQLRLGCAASSPSAVVACLELHQCSATDPETETCAHQPCTSACVDVCMDLADYHMGCGNTAFDLGVCETTCRVAVASCSSGELENVRGCATGLMCQTQQMCLEPCLGNAAPIMEWGLP